MNDTTFGESWIPQEKGDSIEGVLERYDEAPTRDYGMKDIAVLNTDDGPRSVWFLATALGSQFARVRPKVGERVVVTFLGERTSERTERTYKDFKVDCPDRPPYVPDFDKYAGEKDEGIEDE